MARKPRVRLTGRAMQYLNLVVELGHLDEEAVNQVLLSLEPKPGTRAAVLLADVSTIRSAVAWAVADRLEGAEPEGALAEDWNILFS